MEEEHAVVIVDGHAVARGPLKGVLWLELDGSDLEPLLSDFGSQGVYVPLLGIGTDGYTVAGIIGPSPGVSSKGI